MKVSLIIPPLISCSGSWLSTFERPTSDGLINICNAINFKISELCKANFPQGLLRAFEKKSVNIYLRLPMNVYDVEEFGSEILPLKKTNKTFKFCYHVFFLFLKR